MKEQKEVKIIRCAVYTRKSTTKGLEQDFTSLDAQRESTESYIQSQKQLGWVLLPFRYDDGGYTGATTDRPALERLIQDIKDKKIDCVVVYKVDRLSRSLLDFVKLLQFFEDHQITFVSVTQHFDTNTSMGRLTLNILLSFAQFEREMISERTKDKMGAARRKGRWVGGRTPLGYDLDRVNKKLIINPKEAVLAKHMFELYLGKKSLLDTAAQLNQEGYRTKSFQTKNGISGGILFKNTNLGLMLKNATYIGKVEYEGKIYPGDQEATISEELFAKVQALMKANRHERNVSKNRKFKGLLTSVFRCAACEASMCHGYTIKRNNKYRYYICLNAIKRGRKDCPFKSVTAKTVEDKLVAMIRKLTHDPRLNPESWDPLTQEEQHHIFRSIVKVINYDGNTGKLVIELQADSNKHRFDVPLYKFKQRIPRTTDFDFNQEPPIRRQLLLAHQIQNMLDEEKIQDIKQLSKWTYIDRSRLYQIMSLLYLSPQIQEDIIFRDYPKLAKLSERNVRSIVDEISWQKQAALWRILVPAEATFPNQ